MVFLELPDVPWKTCNGVQLVDKGRRWHETGDFADDPTVLRIFDCGVEEQDRRISLDVRLKYCSTRGRPSPSSASTFTGTNWLMAARTAGFGKTSESYRLHHPQL